MEGKRILQLPVLTGNNVTINDVFHIVDTSENIAENRNKRIPVGELLNFLNASLTGLENPNPDVIITQPAVGQSNLLLTVPNGGYSTVYDIHVYRNGLLLAQGGSYDYTYTATGSPNLSINFIGFTTVSNEIYQVHVFKD